LKWSSIKRGGKIHIITHGVPVEGKPGPLNKGRKMKTELEITVKVEVEFTYIKPEPAYEDCPAIEAHVLIDDVSFGKTSDFYKFIVDKYGQELIECAQEQAQFRKETNEK